MNPIDYTSTFDNLQSPNAALMQGVQMGGILRQQQAAQAQQEQAQASQAAMNADLAMLSQNPTPDAIGRLTIKYPQLAKELKQSSEILAPAQQQANLDHATEVYAAINNNELGIAQDLLKKRAEALRNSGDERRASTADTMAALIKDHPEFAKTTIGLRVAAELGPEKFAAAVKNMGEETRANALAPAELAKAQADARKAGADATVAAATVPQQIEKVNSDLLTAEQKRRLDEFDSQIKGADSETKRGQLTLERDKFVADQGIKQQELGQSAQSQIDSAQIALDNIRSLRASPLMKDTVGNSIAGLGTVIGQMVGNIPGTENKDFRGQLESLKAQVFLPAVQAVKGMGSLSNSEGDKLTASVTALDANMSPKAFAYHMGVAEKFFTKGLQKGLATKSVPTQGGGFVVNHPTFGAVKEGDINRLMKQYPGSTREQIMTFLNSGGK